MSHRFDHEGSAPDFCDDPPKSAPAKAICPECTQGKHQNCVGQAWNDVLDTLVECECTHG